MKKIIRAAWTGRTLNEDKLCRALLQYRNAPSRKDGLSPAQKLYSHPIQDTLPAHHTSFAPLRQQVKERLLLSLKQVWSQVEDIITEQLIHYLR